MLIYDVLKKDHQKLKSILTQIEETTERAIKRRRELLAKVKQELIPHARAEEQSLYEALKKERETEALSYEGYEEHAVADHLLEQLNGMDPSDKRWTAKFSVFKENLEHHIDEEEREMFKQARKVFTKEEAQDIAVTFVRLKEEIIASQLDSHELPVRQIPDDMLVPTLQ